MVLATKLEKVIDILLLKNNYKFIIKSYKKDKKMALFFLLSLTFYLAAYGKDKKGSKEKIREFIITRNWQYFLITPLVVVLVWFFEMFDMTKFFIVAGGIYAFWRVNEIFIAFVSDATSHLRNVEHSSSLKYYERIPLAMRSYIELILLYGILAFVLQSYFQSMSCNNTCETCILTMWQALYYSGVTITTLGYGEITPNNFISQFMSIFEVINGFLLIVVSFAIYVSKSLSAEEFKNT